MRREGGRRRSGAVESREKTREREEELGRKLELVLRREEEEEEERVTGGRGKETAEMARRSNFAVTCGLLSRYIKEKGSVAELGLDMASQPQEDPKGKSEAIRQPTTTSLLPGADVSSVENDESVTEGEDTGNSVEMFPQITREQGNTQLTIFYRGDVLVFDDFPAEKAKDLMQLARDYNSAEHSFVHISPSLTVPVATSRVSFDQNSPLAPLAANPPLVPQGLPSRTAQPSLPDLPIARRASLQRFLKRRKDR